jgi:hypothetical protein
VHGLRHHPVSRGHDDPVGGHQADGYRPSEAEEREYPRVIQHETLRNGINVTAGLRGGQHEYDHDRSGDQCRHDLRQVVASRSLCSRMHTLTTA